MKLKRAVAAAAILGGVGLVPSAATATDDSPPDTVPIDCEERDPVPETVSYYYRKHAWSEQGGVGVEFGFQGGSPSEGPYDEPQTSFAYQNLTIEVDVPFQIRGGWYIVIEEVVPNGNGVPGNVPGPECFPCDWPQVKQTAAGCGEFGYDVSECGSVTAMTTFKVSNKPWPYAAWLSESLPANPADGTPNGPLSFPEDYNGGSVTVYAWVAGAENDAFQSHDFPTWDAPLSVVVDTDCRSPQPPDETHEWTDYGDWVQGDPECGDTEVEATRSWVKNRRVDTYVWDDEAGWVLVHGEKQVIDEGTESKAVTVEAEPCPTTTTLPPDDTDGDVDDETGDPGPEDEGPVVSLVEPPLPPVAAPTTIPPTTVAGQLPVTGSDGVSSMATVGIALIAAGGVCVAAVFLSRRRSATS